MEYSTSFRSGTLNVLNLSCSSIDNLLMFPGVKVIATVLISLVEWFRATFLGQTWRVILSFHWIHSDLGLDRATAYLVTGPIHDPFGILEAGLLCSCCEVR